MVSVAQRSSARANASPRGPARTAAGNAGAGAGGWTAARIATAIIMPASAATPASLIVREEACSTASASVVAQEAAEPLAPLGFLGSVPRGVERLCAALRCDGGGQVGELL